VGKKLRARADRHVVSFYDNGQLVKTHMRQPAGGRSTDSTDFPQEKTAYALRDVKALERQAERHGAAVGRFAHELLDSPLPWTRMRRVYALLGLVRRYGEAAVEQACVRALGAEMIDVYRLRRMLEIPAPPSAAGGALSRVVPIARLPPSRDQYRLRLVPSDQSDLR